MKLILALLIVLMIPMSTIAQVKTLYVDTASIGGTCDDTAGNTRATNAIDNPWCTLEVADTRATDGDTILVRAGTYDTVDPISFDNDGVVGAWIYWKSYPRRAAKLVGSVEMHNSYSTLEGFDITNNTAPSTTAGFGVRIQADQIKILDNYIHDTKHTAINSYYALATGVEVAYNHIYKCQRGLSIIGDSWYVHDNHFERCYLYLDTKAEDSDYMTVKGDNLVIARNIMDGNVEAEVHRGTEAACTLENVPHDCCTGPGAGCDAHMDCQFILANADHNNENILIEDNYCEGFDQGIITDEDASSAWWIFRNNVYANSLPLSASGYGLHLSGNQHFYIYNNTFYNIKYRGVYARTYPTIVPDYILIKNNIFHTVDRAYSWEVGGTNCSADYNDRYLCSNPPTPTPGVNDITTDPGMVSPATENFTLILTANAKDAGSWLTTITTAGGTSDTFTVADAGYFWDGQGVTLGDTIKFETGLVERTITDITGNVITVDSPVTWVQYSGIALRFEGTKPDMGAAEYAIGKIAAPGCKIDGGVKF